MFGLDRLEKMFSPSYLEVKLGQCLRLRHKGSSCQLCFENCPHDAISFDGLLQVDNALCNGCGVCVNLCPTGVFELVDLPYEQLLSQVVGEGRVEFTCSLSPQDKGGLTVPCLGYLNETVLTGAITQGCEAVRLNTSQCMKCNFASGQQAALKSMGRANRILTLFGMPGKISASDEEPGNACSLGKGEPYSRREFLSFLRQKAGSRVAAAIEGAVDDQETLGKTKVTLEPRLPKKRSLLLEHINKLGQPVTDRIKADDLPFAQVEIGEQCDGCGRCATFCPSGALRCYERGDEQVIDFYLGYCLACHLCRDVCPESAITYSAHINPFDLILEERKTLIKHRKLHCQRCGQSHIATTGSSLCLNRGKEKALKEWLVKTWAGSAKV